MVSHDRADRIDHILTLNVLSVGFCVLLIAALALMAIIERDAPLLAATVAAFALFGYLLARLVRIRVAQNAHWEGAVLVVSDGSRSYRIERSAIRGITASRRDPLYGWPLVLAGGSALWWLGLAPWVVLRIASRGLAPSRFVLAVNNEDEAALKGHVEQADRADCQ